MPNARHLRLLAVLAVLGTVVASVWSVQSSSAREGSLVVDGGQGGAVAQAAWASTGTVGSSLRQVAAAVQAPPIVAGAMRAHEDRGPCSACHMVSPAQGGVGAMGQPQASTTSPGSFAGPSAGQAFWPVAQLNVPRPSPSVIPPPSMVTPLSPSATPSVIPPLSTGPGTGGTGGTPGNPAGTRTPAPETEWKGIEVRADALGLLVVDAEGQAGQAGLLAGDVINSINGIATGDERAFADATVNGTLPQGVVVATRAGERLAFELRSPATNTGNGNAATTTQSAAGIGAAPGGGVPGF